MRKRAFWLEIWLWQALIGAECEVAEALAQRGFEPASAGAAGRWVVPFVRQMAQNA
jgi:hypothetical protein